MLKKIICLAFACLLAVNQTAAETENILVIPPVGFHQLRILTPTTLELTLITTKPSPRARVNEWDFVSAEGQLNLPAPEQFVVTTGTRANPVQQVGFKRRVRYAPLAPRDLRIGNYLYLQLATPISSNEVVTVTNPDGKLWQRNVQFTGLAAPLRYNPALHVNQVGYNPQFPKTAMVGYFLGSLGELEVPAESKFMLVDSPTGNPVFHGELMPRPDVGFPDSPPPYQKVFAADFSDFATPGEYRLVVPGLGASLPFFIHDGAAAAWARTYALGLYHQRCGTNNALPFTRFTHDPCHVAPAEVPTAAFTSAAKFIARASENFAKNPRHSPHQLKDFTTSLYPFVRHGRVDVSGGHHDAGDYSKYTLNSAGLIHTLMFAADALPGVGALDNLGLPESGDGKSDLLQLAKWEADFLAKLQDDDGGFYFLVYPRERAYENDVLPDRGDPQIVWPKNTAATAAAVAALAQTASSPLFKKEFPAAASSYLAQAKKGWAFLERALAQHGRDGAYQKITHYGDDFMHDDELAWAACELFLATGEDVYHQALLEHFDPTDAATRRWGWWRLYESYGRAIRSYAFAVQTGRASRAQLDATFGSACETEVLAAGQDQSHWSQQSAYGTSFPTETKRFRGGGWYFSLDQAFDLAVASALDHPVAAELRPEFLAAILANLNYEAGGNPVNVSYLTGLGWKRQSEIVHHYAMNDRRQMPPDGLPLGNIQSSFMWLENYREELGALSFPPDGAPSQPYPIYDRWSDSFNVQTEFVIGNQARALATTAFLMAQTSVKDQPWRGQSAKIELRALPANGGAPRYLATLSAAPLDLHQARLIWEAPDHAPEFGASFVVTAPENKPIWIEATAHWPDGRRVFAVTNLTHSRLRAGGR